MPFGPRIALFLFLALISGVAVANGSLHTTYLWHLHQPIYWPDQRRAGGDDQCENAWDSIQQRDLGATHPENDLRDIFGKDDRVAAYQWRTRDSINSIRGLPDAGAQISYSGALMENVGSLGLAGQLGYSSGWMNSILEAHGWLTSGGHTRCDLVNFAYQHALLPLMSERTQYLQIRLQQEKMQQIWGIAPGSEPGFFPPEMAFSERLIPELQELGIQWVVVSTAHLARACPDFPLSLGSGGVNCDPPNRADQINPPAGRFWTDHIDRGCSPTAAVPFSYIPHRARWIDPATGDASSVIVVGADQTLGWRDGYGAIGASALDPIADANAGAPRPMLVLLAHDGDNAWGGGYSYYMEAVQNFSNDCASRGYSPSTVQEYLADHPVPAGDIVHVEDGAWVNADSDFGSPTFINWNWPLLDAGGQIDPINGWHNKPRELAIFTAAENRIRTAENIQPGGAAATRIAQIMDPGPGTTPVERAWSYYLASMDSGNVYYGNPLDMEVKGTVGCNNAFRLIDPVLTAALTADPSKDTTEPTISWPQRQPYNPGSISFGAQYGYRQFVNDGSFVVWAFIDDVSGVDHATLLYRVDGDGVNPLGSTQNETYAGGPEVGAWQAITMSGRDFPAGNIYNWPGLDYYVLPTHIARHYSATVPPHLESLIDYYIEAVDTRGNVARSPIQHVYVGDGSGQTGGGRVSTDPNPLAKGQSGMILYEDEGGPIEGASTVVMHHGFDNWVPATITDAPMTFNAASGKWEITLDMPADRAQFDCVFNNGAGTWDNNGGSDWHFTLAGPTAPTGNAFVAPDPPHAGESATLIYEASSGPLSAETSIHAHITYNAGAITVSPDPLMVFDGGTNRWETGFTVDPAATSLRATFNDGGAKTDDRNGSPWTWTVIPPVSEVVRVVPDPLVKGATGTVSYDPTGRPLQGASAINIHYGFDNWVPATITDAPMTFNGGSGRWEFTATMPANRSQIDFVFNNGAGAWDNNNTQDWHYPLTAPPPSGPDGLLLR